MGTGANDHTTDHASNDANESRDLVSADLTAVPDDDEARLRVLDELYARLESELDRDLGTTGTPRH